MTAWDRLNRCIARRALACCCVRLCRVSSLAAPSLLPRAHTLTHSSYVSRKQPVCAPRHTSIEREREAHIHTRGRCSSCKNTKLVRSPPPPPSRRSHERLTLASKRSRRRQYITPSQRTPWKHEEKTKTLPRYSHQHKQTILKSLESSLKLSAARHSPSSVRSRSHSERSERLTPFVERRSTYDRHTGPEPEHMRIIKSIKRDFRAGRGGNGTGNILKRFLMR